MRGIDLDEAPVQFMAYAIGAAWALDVAYGSGNDLVPYITQLANLGCGGWFYPEAGDIGNLLNVLASYDTGEFITESKRDELLREIRAIRKGNG
jgi:hypothetical protein